MRTSNEQRLVLEAIINWFKTAQGKKIYITLGGYAGTGKSTIIAVLRQLLHETDPGLRVGFVSYTGKATRVLRGKLQEQRSIYAKDSVSTIHSLIYTPVLNEKKEIIGWQRKDEIEPQLIIIDEASMVDGDIWNHLVAYGKPIIAVGDHGQLPPISGKFNLIEEPQLRLEEIHRQAKTNPIIGLSIQARENGLIRAGEYSDCVKKYNRDDPDGAVFLEELLDSFDYDTLILCGYNRTRKKLNSYIRQKMGFESPEPQPGDRVICLRNNYEKKIFNGMLGTVSQIEKESDRWYYAKIAMDDEIEEYKGLISADQFKSESGLNFTGKRSQTLAGDLFDFGYALTVHKAQGSQSKRVILFEERFPRMTDDDWRRWLYTGITRAQEELYIFGSAMQGA